MTTEELPEEETVESFETANAQAEVSDLPEPQAEQIPEVSSEPEEETQTRIDETPAEEPVAAADDAVDVSASIISNFAKMFSNENAAAEVDVRKLRQPFCQGVIHRHRRSGRPAVIDPVAGFYDGRGLFRRHQLFFVHLFKFHVVKPRFL